MLYPHMSPPKTYATLQLKILNRLFYTLHIDICIIWWVSVFLINNRVVVENQQKQILFALRFSIFFVLKFWSNKMLPKQEVEGCCNMLKLYLCMQDTTV